MTRPERGLLDSSVFIAVEHGRPLLKASLPEATFVSVVTIAELTAGVLAATETAIRARRLATLEAVMELNPLPIGAVAARRWAALRVKLAEQGLRANVNDLWIAAVADANGLPVVTQDADFDPIEAVGGPTVIRV